uniref:glycosyltransferase n=1 Tax=Flavobacterium sp. TaxID=239 RepID=UPI00404A046E
MKCSVIIRSYNEEKHIGKLLQGIYSQELSNGLELEVILVDSGSTDSTISIAKKLGARVVSILNEEFSFGRALNLGCSASSGEVLLFASAHVYPVYTDWISKIVSLFRNPDVAAVYGRQVGNNLTKFSESQIFSKWFPAQSNYNQVNPFCNNANCAIRRSCWEILPYDESLTGLEDLAWANKILKMGFKIAYEAEAVIVHVHEETPKKIRNRYYREAIAFKHIFPRIKFTLLEFLYLLISNILLDSVHAIRLGVFIQELNWIIVFRFNQFYGTYLGHKQKGEISKDLKNKFYFPLINSEKHKLSHVDIFSKKIDYGINE